MALAAAFEIGRLLALSQLSVVSALLRFRAEQFGAGRVREMLQLLVPFTLPKALSNAGPKAVDLGRYVAVQVVDVLAKNRERMLGPQRPLADPGREIKVDGDIDRLIAEGLGLDYASLVKRNAELGVLASLTRTQAPVSGRVGEGKFGRTEQNALADALTQELNRTLAVAMPKVVLRPPGVNAQNRSRASAQAPAEPARDALDELIERALGAGDDDDKDPAR